MTKNAFKQIMAPHIQQHFAQIGATAQFLPNRDILIEAQDTDPEHDIIKHLWKLTSKHDIDLIEYTMHVVLEPTEEGFITHITITPIVIES